MLKSILTVIPILLVVACGDSRSVQLDGSPSSSSEGDPFRGSEAGPPASPRCDVDLGAAPTGLDHECKGLSGCTEITVTECGCHCSLCDGELCLQALCDDSCMPTCPSTKPDEGGSCPWSDPGFTCDYLIDTCPCGPSDLYWHCTCQNGSWSCGRDYDCYPCADIGAGVDAGP